MANKDYSKEDGVWRTIGGRRVFIRTGQSLSDAMKESGKFSRVQKNQELYKKLDEENKKEEKSKEEYSFAEIVDEMERAEDYSDLYSASEKIADKDLRKEVEDAISQAESDGFEVSEAYSTITSDYLDTKARQGEKNVKKPIHELGQTNETDEKINLDSDEVKKSLQETKRKADEWRKEHGEKEIFSDKEKGIETKESDYPRAVGAKDFSDYGIGPMEEWSTDWEKEFSDYLRDKYGTDDIDIITTGSERTPNSLEEDFMKQYKDKKENKGFVQENTQHGGTREYSAEELKRMEDNGIRPMKRSYSGYGWEGVNSKQNLTTSEQAKAITDAMKKKYPDVKVARRSDVYSGGSSIDFNIMSSDKDIFISDKDIDKLGNEQLYNTEITRGYEFDRWAEDNVPSYKTEHTYSVDDVKRYAKEQLAEMKKHDIRATGNEWFLNDYGKKVVSDLNKEANSYTFDDSDGMVDYFHHGTYMDVHIGKWDKPYEVKGNSMTSALKNKAYQKYMKEHPSSKMTLAEFKKMNK